MTCWASFRRLSLVAIAGGAEPHIDVIVMIVQSINLCRSLAYHARRAIGPLRAGAKQHSTRQCVAEHVCLTVNMTRTDVVCRRSRGSDPCSGRRAAAGVARYGPRAAPRRARLPRQMQRHGEGHRCLVFPHRLQGQVLLQLKLRKATAPCVGSSVILLRGFADDPGRDKDRLVTAVLLYALAAQFDHGCPTLVQATSATC